MNFRDISVLNEDVLIEVFSNLSFREKLNVQRVNRRFRDVIGRMMSRDHELRLFYSPNWKPNWTDGSECFIKPEIDFFFVHFNELALESNFWLKSFLAKFQSLRRLRIRSENKTLKCALLERVFQLFPELVSLKLVNSTLEAGQNTAWRHLVTMTSNLEAFEFEAAEESNWTRKVAIKNAHGIRDLAKNCRSLEEFSIQTFFGNRLAKTLRQRSELRRMKLQIKTLTQLKTAVRNKPKLRDLAVDFGLQTLNLFDLLDSLDACAALRKLRLDCRQVAFWPVALPLYKKGFKELGSVRQLEISNLNLTSRVMANIAKKVPWVTSLKLLRFWINDLDLDSGPFFDVFAEFWALQKLVLSYNSQEFVFPSNVLDRFLNEWHLPNLRHLEANCFGKTECFEIFYLLLASSVPDHQFVFGANLSCQDVLFKAFRNYRFSNVKLLFNCICGEPIYHREVVSVEEPPEEADSDEESNSDEEYYDEEAVEYYDEDAGEYYDEDPGEDGDEDAGEDGDEDAEEDAEEDAVEDGDVEEVLVEDLGEYLDDDGDPRQDEVD